MVDSMVLVRAMAGYEWHFACVERDWEDVDSCCWLMCCMGYVLVVAEESVNVARLGGLGQVVGTRLQGHSLVLLFLQELQCWFDTLQDAETLAMDAGKSHHQ